MVYNTQKILKKTSKHDIISFDMFDTLVTRITSNPKQLFDIIEKNYNINHTKKINNFKINRINTEQSLNVPNIDDIYSEMEKYYPKEICNKLKKMEIEHEIKYCYPVEEIKEIYNFLLKQNKKIYITSDMYLKSDTLEKILNKCGYKDYQEILVSCEKKATKRSSKLFKYIKGGKIIHIGDSYKADIIGPIKAGISCIKVPKKYYNDNSNIKKMNKLFKTKNYFENLGLTTLGPIIYLFSDWLNSKVNHENIKTLYFLSREGQIFKESFEKIYKDKNINTKYLNVSRKTLTLANYNYKKFNTNEEILKYFTIKKDSTLKDTIKHLNLNINVPDDLKDKNIYTLTNNNIFDQIKEKLSTISKKESTITYEYLKQNKMTGKFAIVDIGWNGTMQKCINSLLKNNNVNFEMHGYYFLSKNTNKHTHSFLKIKDICYNSIKNNPVLIENMFQSIEGSTIGYTKNKNIIIPVKQNIEFDKYSIQALKQIKKGINIFLNLSENYLYFKNKVEFTKEVQTKLNNFINKPTKQDIDKFKDFTYSDISINKIISKDKINFKKGIYASAWKSGYMKSIFKINIDYGKLINLLKK